MDLREHLRFLIHCAITLKVNNHTEEGNLMNLSVSGCGIESVSRLQVGDNLTVLVHLPDGKPPMEIDVATVRWAQGDRLGLQFLRLRQEERERLSQFIDALETDTIH
jgi:hypothetical protein